MIISLPIYRVFKNLCRYFKRTSNAFEIINNHTIIVRAGKFSGLIFDFSLNICEVKTWNNLNICLDITKDFSIDGLIKVLINHNIIRLNDIEIGG